MNKSSIPQIPQCMRQKTHKAPFSKIFLLQNGALWDMGLVHCGICAMGLLINQKFGQQIFGQQIWILRHKKILDREDLYHWYGDLILIHSK